MRSHAATPMGGQSNGRTLSGNVATWQVNTIYGQAKLNTVSPSTTVVVVMVRLIAVVWHKNVRNRTSGTSSTAHFSPNECTLLDLIDFVNQFWRAFQVSS